MELKLYNTLTREKEVFRPLDPARVRMYVCGPTVYDHAHIGNARPLIVFDVLYRLLRHLYGEKHVTYVRNITDVDDKINARAAERKIPIRELTEETYRDFKTDVAALGCLEPTIEPRATEYVQPMIEMIKKLIAAGHAYPAEGHVLFDVTSKPDYGKLARRSLDEMLAGARVEVAPYKKNPMDFVLWKPSTPELPGWDSPWGRGRPGWHIECSAMGEALLGPTFDIHGGGIDLAFPHHENEIAQSECVHGGAPLAQVWMHNGFLQVEGKKMAKSEGNFVTVRGLLLGWGGIPQTGDTIRLAMMMTHYRQPLDWTLNKVATAGANLHTFHTVGKLGLGLDEHTDIAAISEIRSGRVSDRLFEHLLDDLNTPAVILSHLFSLVKEADQKGGVREGPAKQLLTDCLFLGLDPFRFVRDELAAFDAHRQIDDKQLNDMIAARDAARKAKNFKEADRIRDELKAMGVVLEDKKDGTTTWEVAR